MISINFIISLIKQTKKVKSLTLLLTYRKFGLYANSSRLFCNSNNIVSDNDKDKIKTNKIKKNISKKIVIKEKKEKILNDFYHYTTTKKYEEVTNPELAKICTKKYMKEITNREDILYLMEKDTATKFIKLIIDDLSKDMSFVAECNPGIGILTEELLKAGIKNIYAYETNCCFYPMLDKLRMKYPDRLEIRNVNLFKMSKLHFMDQQDDKDRISKVLQDTPDISWENESTFMQVIGVSINIKFFRHLILALVFRTSFMKFGRPSFYLAITPSIWNVLSSPGNRAMSYYLYISFQTLFNCKDLGDVERVSYIPRPKQSLRKTYIRDYEILKVVKIEPKADLFNNYLELEEIILYWYFIKYHFVNQKQRVIPELEKWIPGCGTRLIRMDYTVFTRFVDLTPVECLNIYKEFTSWPEFKSSLFTSSAYSYIEYFNRVNTNFDVKLK